MSDIYYNKKVFCNFIKTNFDMKENNILLKYKHTLLVAKLAKKLAKKLNLDQTLAYNIGLLHDISRFEQYTKFKSFTDAKTFDHGTRAAELLFEEKLIEQFKLAKKFYPIIKASIFFHNKKTLTKSELSEYLNNQNLAYPLDEIYLYCNLIRDADKIDILRVVSSKEYKLENPNNGITPILQKNFENFEVIDKKNLNTKLDIILVHLSFAYSLYFPQSYSLFNLKHRLNQAKTTSKKCLNQADYNLLCQEIELLEPHLKKILKNC